MPTHPLEELLHPRSVAVVGASDRPGGFGYSFTRHLLDYGFRGQVYPVNPNYPQILGFKAYPNLLTIPGTVDYVISCVPAGEVLNMLAECPAKGVKLVHLYTARFSETGRRQAAELEQEVLRQARKSGIRLIGPNCMGLYYPKEGISFAYDLPREPGFTGMASQTGGGAATFVQLAAMRGIRFSKVISYGNALDFDESDYLNYFTQDSETKIIVMYIEGVKNGPKFYDALHRAAASKPVIVTKGGRGQSGTRAAASHTASLAGTARTWKTVIAQAGALWADNLDEMIDLAVSFYFLPPIRGLRVGITGGGGGPSVLSADECEEAGLEVVPLPPEIREELKVKAHPIWDWISNPVDVSILGGFGVTSTDMLRMMANSPDFDLLLANITEVPLARKEDAILRFRNEADDYITIRKESSKPLLVVLAEKSPGVVDYNHWRWQLTSELRTKYLAANIPIYPSVARAARATRKVLYYYRRNGEKYY